MKTEMRSGSTRVVFLVGGVAIKIPRPDCWRLFLHGLLANMQERLWSGQSPSLARVIWADRFGFVVVMERARPVEDWEAAKRLIICDPIGEPLHEFLVSDLKRDNWGIGRVGQLIKIDYGG